MVYGFLGKVAGFLFSTWCDIGGDTSLDGVGTIINLGRINIIPCMCTSCSLSLSANYPFNKFLSASACIPFSTLTSSA